MEAAPLPADEARRLARLQELGVLGSEPEPLFDSIAHAASLACGAPISLLSLVDRERLWFKAAVGLAGVHETPRGQAFCAHAILGDAVFQVLDARRDPRFAGHPLVAGAPALRFYAGAPLVLPTGERLGTLCVMGQQPGCLNDSQAQLLRSLASTATQALLMRQRLWGQAAQERAGLHQATRQQLEQQLADSERFVRTVTDNLPQRIAYIDAEGRFRFVNQAHCQRFGLPREQVLGRTRSELTGGASDATVGPRMAAALAGQAQRFEYEEVVAGRPLRIESQLMPDVGEDGRVRGFFSTGVDITERAATERALRELSAIIDNTPDFVVQTDTRGRITYLNPAVRQVLGLTADEPVGERNFAEFNPPETNRLFADVVVPAVQAQGRWLGQTQVWAAGRRPLAVSHLVIGHRDARGRIERWSAVMRDISDEHRARLQQQHQAATLRTVTEALPIIVSAVDTELRYRFVNSAFERWYGMPRERILNHRAEEVMAPADIERSRAWAERALAGETVQFERAYPERPGAPHLALTYVPVRLDNGAIDGFIGIAQDITQHQREKLQLRQLSQRDPLTGLLNRAGFEQALQHSGAQVALLYIDLDHFKPINDQHGHPVGDELLRQFGQRLQTLVRPSDAVARVGGDEFAVLLGGVRVAAHAHAVADKVLAAAHQAFEVAALRLHIGASVGVAFGIAATGGWGELVARADAQLYEAKRGGRGRRSGG